jgi:pyrroline-5-carboxylate reductase
MLSDDTVAVIGAGNIGRALIGGMLHAKLVAPEQIVATRRSESALFALQDQFPGLRTTTDNVEAAEGATILLLTIKPQSRRAVVTELRPHVKPGTLVLSVLAGITTTTLQEDFGQTLPVVRTMPNTPALVEAGATALAAGAYAEAEHVAKARAIFEAVGAVETVREELMDAVTGLSGSGPAYVYMFIEALTDAGVKQGLARPIAMRLATETVYGAAKLVRESGEHPAILRDQVTTPGGTSIAAIAELEAHGLRTMLMTTVATATARSKELSEE